VSFGTLGMFSKLFYDNGGHPFELLVVRCVGTGLVVWSLWTLRRGRIASRSSAVLGLSLGIFQLGATYALLEGFDRAPAGLVVLLFYVYPLLVNAGSALFLGEPLGVRRAALLVVGLGGIALTVGAPTNTPAAGVVLGLTAGVCTATYIVAARYVMTRPRAVEPLEFVALVFTAPAIGLAIAAGVHGFRVPSGEGIGYGIGLVAVPSVLALLLFYAAVRLVGGGTASLLATVEPLVAVVLAYVVLHESLEAMQLLGGCVILASVVAVTLPAPRRRRRDPVAAVKP
jgi:drug/metabolite transporter (DMT)-like permease